MSYRGPEVRTGWVQLEETTCPNCNAPLWKRTPSWFIYVCVECDLVIEGRMGRNRDLADRVRDLAGMPKRRRLGWPKPPPRFVSDEEFDEGKYYRPKGRRGPDRR